MLICLNAERMGTPALVNGARILQLKGSTKVIRSVAVLRHIGVVTHISLLLKRT